MEELRNVSLGEDGGFVEILDQTLLPGRVEYLRLRELEEMVEAIRSLRVRGAPAIGICAGYCLYVRARSIRAKTMGGFLEELEKTAEALNASRPTAVNLSWALRRMSAAAALCASPEEALRALKEECGAIHREDILMCRAISEYGLSLLREGDTVLTHCNAGPLATSRYGTAIGPLLLGRERGMKLHAFADETRPLLQGARLTSLELYRAGVDVTLICDNMAASVMQKGWIDAVFVGCDRVAANGDTANKIGTSGVAVLAKHYGVPFYVLGPTSTIDLGCASGAEIVIEERDPEEIRSKLFREPMAPSEVRCYNPAFDVTDSGLITGIVTERGICRPPYEKSLRALFEGPPEAGKEKRDAHTIL